MNLHYAHSFTHGASVDGSKAGVEESILTGSGEGIETAEDRSAPAAYGCWEGVEPFGEYTFGVAVVTSTEKEKHEAVERGLSGGRLPDSFSSVDCEMYAILAYLRKVCELSPGETEADLKNRRVLILCDCQPCLKSIEEVYRKGNTRGLHRRDRGGDA